MKRGILECILAVLLVLFLVSFSSAIVGVSPPQYKVTFTPNQNLIFKFGFLGDSEVPMRVYMEGELAQYAELSTEKLGGSGEVNVLLKLPGSLNTPGNHVLYVGVEQEGAPGGGAAIRGGMKATINVFVPYPGRYIVLDFYADDTRQGENMSYALKAFNYGDEKVSVSPIIEIFNLENKSVGRYSIYSDVIAGNSVKEDSGKIGTSMLPAGNYIAKATVNYGERIASAEDTFRIGELNVEIKNFSDVIDRNTINKILVDVESAWNDPIENVFVEGSVPEYNIAFKTPSTSLKGFQRVSLLGYLDTNNILEDVDSLEVNFTVHFSNKLNSKSGTLNFRKVSKVSSITYAIIGISLFIIIAGGVIWILIRKRREQ